MKKLVSLLVCIAVLLTLCACDLTVSSVKPTAVPSVAPAAAEKAPEAMPSAEPEAEVITATQKIDDGPAEVIFYNSSSALEVELNALAEAYSGKTGTTVKIITVTEEYENSLATALDSEDAPTIFALDYKNKDKFTASAYDLSGTSLSAKSIAGDLNIHTDEKLLGLAYDYICFGVAVNVPALESTNHYISDINNFYEFKTAVKDIQQQFYNNKRVAAFAEPALSGDMWRYTTELINPAFFFECLESGITEQPPYIRYDFSDNVRAFYELWYSNTPSSRWYLNNVSTDVPKSNFASGKVAFYPCGSWELEELVNNYGADANSLAMIPMYMDIRNEQDYAMTSGQTNWWCVNREVSANDIEASMAFLEYVADNGAELAKLAAMPFEGLTASNSFLASSNRMLANGFKPVALLNDWLPGIAWEEACFDWLIKYTTGYGDWVQYTDEFIIGWQNGYAEQNKY